MIKGFTGCQTESSDSVQAEGEVKHPKYFKSLCVCMYSCAHTYIYLYIHVCGCLIHVLTLQFNGKKKNMRDPFLICC